MSSFNKDYPITTVFIMLIAVEFGSILGIPVRSDEDAQMNTN